MTNTAPPPIGQEPWGQDLNAYLAWLQAEIDLNTANISINTAGVAALNAQVAALSRRITVIGRWQTNTQVGAAPGGMQVTSDTGNFRQATWLRFAKVDQSNTEMSEMLRRAVYLIVQHQNDSTMWAHLHVTGTVDVQSGYVQVPVNCHSYGAPGVAWQNVTVTMMVDLP
jgi:hypothetical protein